MYIIRGKKPNHKFILRIKTLVDAMKIADEKIEEGFTDVNIEAYNGQLPLFNVEYDGPEKIKNNT